jgi:hypothetical protein
MLMGQDSWHMIKTNKIQVLREAESWTAAFLQHEIRYGKNKRSPGAFRYLQRTNLENQAKAISLMKKLRRDIWELKWNRNTNKKMLQERTRKNLDLKKNYTDAVVRTKVLSAKWCELCRAGLQDMRKPVNFFVSGTERVLVKQNWQKALQNTRLMMKTLTHWHEWVPRTS